MIAEFNPITAIENYQERMSSSTQETYVGKVVYEAGKGDFPHTDIDEVHLVYGVQLKNDGSYDWDGSVQVKEIRANDEVIDNGALRVYACHEMYKILGDRFDNDLGLLAGTELE